MNRISAKLDPELTNDITGSCTKYLFSQYKNDILQGCKTCIAKMISWEVV